MDNAVHRVFEVRYLVGIPTNMTVSKSPRRSKTYGVVTFSDPLAATIFDRRATDFKTGLRGKDFVRCGSIVSKLYRQAAENNASAKQALERLVSVIQTNRTALDSVLAEIHAVFDEMPIDQQIPTRPGAALSFDVGWNNKMFLSILQMLIDFDKARTQLITLKDRNKLDDSAYHRTALKLLKPIRSIVEQIYPVAKSVG